MAYVYKHIRLDTLQPFYIGIGVTRKYGRASTKQNRNKWWHNIINKSGYKVEIIFDNITWEEAQQKEVELISFYGRKDKGGILCNLTNGGGGGVGLIVSEETRNKQRLQKLGKPSKNKGRPMPLHVIAAIVKANTGRVSWNKGKSVSNEAKEKRKETMLLVGYKKGASHPMFGKTHTNDLKAKWRNDRKGSVPWNKGYKNPEHMHIVFKEAHKEKMISVCQYDMNGDFMKIFNSIGDASKESGAGKGNISLCCKLKRKSAGGYIWKMNEAS